MEACTTGWRDDATAADEEAPNIKQKKVCVVCVEGDGDGGGNVVMVTRNDNAYGCDSNKSYVVVDGLFVCIKCSLVVLATPGRPCKPAMAKTACKPDRR